MDKTNVMRILTQQGIEFIPHQYDNSITDGMGVALSIGKDPQQVFKTLVTISNCGNYFIFVIPVTTSLNLKKAAQAAEVKNIQMIKQKDLLPLTGYIHGGCSPIGMKKQFPTFIEEGAMLFDNIVISAGKVGYQVELHPQSLISIINGKYDDLI